MVSRPCDRPLMEELFNSIIAGMALEGLIGAGSWIDAGANDGSTACFFSGLTNGTVHAVDPSAANVRNIRSLSTHRQLPNLKALHGGLSNVPRQNVRSRGKDKVGAYNSALLERIIERPRRKPPSIARHLADSSTASDVVSDAQHTNHFDVFRLDDLFATTWQAETMAFGHFDVDGMELMVLEGSVQTIMRDRPILTLELEVWKDPAHTLQLIEFLIERLRYEPWLVEEAAGYRQDTRNLIAFPSRKEKRAHHHRRRFRESSTLAVAVASRRLLAVTRETIQHLAFPCCVSGGECCPRRKGVCCSARLVHAWLAHYHAVGGHDLQWYTRSQWFSNGLYTKNPLDHEAWAKHQLEQMRRPPNRSGYDAYIDDGVPGSWARCFNGSCYHK